MPLKKPTRRRRSRCSRSRTPSRRRRFRKIRSPSSRCRRSTPCQPDATARTSERRAADQSPKPSPDAPPKRSGVLIVSENAAGRQRVFEPRRGLRRRTKRRRHRTAIQRSAERAADEALQPASDGSSGRRIPADRSSSARRRSTRSISAQHVHADGRPADDDGRGGRIVRAAGSSRRQLGDVRDLGRPDGPARTLLR